VGGDWAAALIYARQACVAFDRGSVPFPYLAPWYRIESLLHAGFQAEAQAAFERIGARLAANRRTRIGYLRALAALEQARAETELATAHLQEAAVVAAEIGLLGQLQQINAALDELRAAG
jgi:hypothetical protein